MGAYLTQPKTDKASTDERNEYLIVGASSMQGWRNSQEDAHNAILNFDTDSSFFAVYDGHGGAEVATYCADKLPAFLKDLEAYKLGELEQALKDAFLEFDRTLLKSQVVDILKVLAGEKNIGDAADSDAMDGDDDEENLAELHEESNLPLHEVLEKYKGVGSGCGPSLPVLSKLKDSGNGSKPQSPYLRGRRAAAVAADAANKAVMDPDAKPQGSSTSAAARAAGASSSNDAGPSSSRASLAGIPKMDTDEPEEDSTVSSSSSSASKSNNNNNNTASTEGTEAEAAVASAATKKITTNGANSESCISPDSSHVKETEQNGNVTSSEVKVIKSAENSTATKIVGDATVSGSNDAAENKQNGNVGSSSNQEAAAKTATATTVDGAAISSTSKASKKMKNNVAGGDDDSTDDDADYDVENSSADENEGVYPPGYSSSEDIDEDDADDDDDDEDGDDEDEDDDDDEEVEEEDEEDADSALANEQFCANMIEEPGKDSGCTAVVALLNGRDLYVANAGDSRCVVCRNGKAIEMSLDHKPEDDEESSRIIKAGGRVTTDGRVNGGLNLSRAIGDHAYKMNLELRPEEQMISALPDIKKLIITPEDEFMILACDGIWNYMTSDEVVDFVRNRLKDKTKKTSAICEELFENCLAPNTMGDGTGCDNMTAVIVCFQSSLMRLPTKINATETEDVLAIKRAAEAEAADIFLQRSLERCAPPMRDVLAILRDAEANGTDIFLQRSWKRCASPTRDGNSNEAENADDGTGNVSGANKTKRLKTDDENESTSSTTTNNSNKSDSNITTATTTTTRTATANVLNTESSVVASSSSGGSNLINSTIKKSEKQQQQCDSASTAISTTATTTNITAATTTTANNNNNNNNNNNSNGSSEVTNVSST